MVYQVTINTTNLTKKYLVHSFHKLKRKITKDFNNKVDWDKTVLILAYVDANVKADVTILGEKHTHSFYKRIVVERRLDLDNAILDCNCTIGGRIVFKEE